MRDGGGAADAAGDGGGYARGGIFEGTQAIPPQPTSAAEKLAALRVRREERRRGPRKRWGMLAALAAFPAVAMAAPGDWRDDLFAAKDAAPQLVPMGFETAGESFPGSAFYYLEDEGYVPLPIEAEIRSDASPVPVSDTVGSAARPLRAAGDTTDIARAQQCLTMAIYYEAASESDAGQRAVAQVVLNRVTHPSYPNTVCGVVFQGSERRTGCQFTFTCDGSLARKPSRVFWDRAGNVARQALAGAVYAPVGLATHYHTTAIHPYWADSLHRVTVIGAHIFYRWRGAAGQAQAFSAAYRGGEPIAAAHPRSADPLSPVEADPIVLARAYESSVGTTASARAASAPPPAYSETVEARGGDALFRGDNLPQGGGLSPLLERSGQWLQRP